MPCYVSNEEDFFTEKKTNMSSDVHQSTACLSKCVSSSPLRCVLHLFQSFLSASSLSVYMDFPSFPVGGAIDAFENSVA